MSSSDYWQKREEEWLERCRKEEVDWNKELSDIYENLADEIEEQISIFLSRYANAAEMTVAQAKEYLSKTDIEYYARLAKKYCRLAELDMMEHTNKRAIEYFSDQANAEMLRYNAAMRISRMEMLQSQLKLRVLAAQSRTESAIEEALLIRAQSEFERQAGILGKTVLENIGRTSDIVHASFHGAKFSTRIWGTHQTKLQKTLNTLLTRGLVLGEGSAKLTRKLRKATGVSLSQAQMLMATELARVQTAAQKSSFEAAGFDQFEFIASPTCCPECKKNDGKHFEVKILEPGKNAPPLHPRCRCSTAAYSDRKDYEEWLDGYSKHKLDYEEWKGRRKPRQSEPQDSGIFGAVGPWGSNVVDKDYIQSAEYRRKFSGLTENSKVNDVIRRFFTGTLTKYSGTNTEAIQIIDANTGETLVRKTGNVGALAVSLTKEESEMIRNYKGQIIGMHNHPSNLMPTGADFAASGYRGYEFGVVGTHDGKVYKYSHGTDPVLASTIDKTLEEACALCKTENEERRICSDMISKLLADWGLSCIEM